MTSLVIQQVRGRCVEAEHPVSAVLVEPSGRVRERIGAPLVTTWRSGAKPFQLEASLSQLPVEVVSGLHAQQIAVGASSHHSEPVHIQAVRELLAQLGHSESDLFCGPHWPVHVLSARQLAREGREATAIYNNCSGKHTYMAAASHQQGWEPDYRDPKHPLQQVVLQILQRRTGGLVMDSAVDGCGVPCWVLPIDGMARAYAQLAMSMTSGEDEMIARIGWSMNQEPLHASGSLAFDGNVMRQASRTVVAKVGAQALLCGAIPDEGVGFAIKVRSGSDVARPVAVAAILNRWFPGLIPDSAIDRWSVVHNCVGRIVGTRVPCWDSGA